VLDFKYQKVMYRARSLKDAHKAFEKDAPDWMARGYILHSRVWQEEKRGCLMGFLLLGVQGHGQLWVTYELTRVAQSDAPNNAP
jgi:hypothetical protein